MQIKICKIFPSLKWEKVTSDLIGDHILNTNVQDQKSILLHCGEKLKRRFKKKKKGFDTVQGINKIRVQFHFSLQGLCT